jgi:toxin ParE1/3/4
MKKRLVLSESAQNDLVEIWCYIAEQSPPAADTYVDRLRERIEVLGEHPLIGTDRSALVEGVRSFPFDHYVVFYCVRADSVEVVRILNGYRDLDSLL